MRGRGPQNHRVAPRRRDGCGRGAVAFALACCLIVGCRGNGRLRERDWSGLWSASATEAASSALDVVSFVPPAVPVHSGERTTASAGEESRADEIAALRASVLAWRHEADRSRAANLAARADAETLAALVEKVESEREEARERAQDFLVEAREVAVERDALDARARRAEAESLRLAEEQRRLRAELDETQQRLLRESAIAHAIEQDIDRGDSEGSDASFAVRELARENKALRSQRADLLARLRKLLSRLPPEVLDLSGASSGTEGTWTTVGDREDGWRVYREDPRGLWNECVAFVESRAARMFASDSRWDFFDRSLLAFVVLASALAVCVLALPLWWRRRRARRELIAFLRRRVGELERLDVHSGRTLPARRWTGDRHEDDEQLARELTVAVTGLHAADGAGGNNVDAGATSASSAASAGTMSGSPIEARTGGGSELATSGSSSSAVAAAAIAALFDFKSGGEKRDARSNPAAWSAKTSGEIEAAAVVPVPSAAPRESTTLPSVGDATSAAQAFDSRGADSRLGFHPSSVTEIISSLSAVDVAGEVSLWADDRPATPATVIEGGLDSNFHTETFPPIDLDVRRPRTIAEILGQSAHFRAVGEVPEEGASTATAQTQVLPNLEFLEELVVSKSTHAAVEPRRDVPVSRAHEVERHDRPRTGGEDGDDEDPDDRDRCVASAFGEAPALRSR